MLRNLHFFNIKPGVDEARILYLWDHVVAEYARSRGCIERRTWKLLDVRAGGEQTQAALYLNEALWPSQQAADAFGQTEMPAEVRKAIDELFSGIESHRNLRYADAGG
jgi:hypothetical protein